MRPEVAICLDEIEAAQELMERKESAAKTCRGWIRRQKERLKELGYKGKTPRKQRRKEG